MKTQFISVTPQNIEETTPFCIKDPKNPGFKLKIDWFTREYELGHRMYILQDENKRQIGYIEFNDSENAWRPVKANNFIFIQCLYIYAKKDKGIGLGSLLLEKVEEYARENNKEGILSLTSKGTWISGKALFEKNGFEKADKKGRFELLVKYIRNTKEVPVFMDWETKCKSYKGWHLLYSDQCPWNKSSVDVIINTAKENDIQIKVTKIETAIQAQNGPSGYGTFALIHNGKLLEDHYISKTRFLNILKKEL